MGGSVHSAGADVDAPRRLATEWLNTGRIPTAAIRKVENDCRHSGNPARGFITILLYFVTCGLWSILTLVQGIMMLSMTDQQFDEKYVSNDKTFPLF